MKWEESSVKSYAELTNSKCYALAPELILTGSGPQTDQVLWVQDGEIKFAGPRGTFESEHPAVTVIDLAGRAIIPGFIDAHTHLGQAFGKAITGGEPAQIWRRIWVPMEGSYDAETVYVSAKWMFLEALRGGFTGINNFAVLNEEKAAAIHQAAHDVGIRLVSSTGGAMPLDGESEPEQADVTKIIDLAITRAEKHLKACVGGPLITPSLCVPAIQAAPGELIRELSAFCASNNVLFQIHTNEHHVEVHWSVARYGMRPLEYFAEHGAVGPHTLHHHCTLVTDSEIEILRETGSGVSYNPLASAWKGDRVAPALAFASRGVRFGVGTDSTRSDALRLLEISESAQRISQGMQLADFSCGAAWTWIDAATRGSADVSGLGHVTGQLKEGLRADFLILDREQPEVLPSWDFEWELVRLYNRDQIEAVFVDGRLVIEQRQPVHWNAKEFLNSNKSVARKMVENAPIIRRHGTSTDARRITNGE
jgi:5-methylthioadenosine/S-adenosylhomocysteine deaminase